MTRLEKSTSTPKEFGTFKGVYIPSILTILGVIMYLRMGWVVGHLGPTLSILIVVLATVITLVTAFSISSIATNMHVGIGGTYYMISRSLGLETGAAIGLPLYMAQTLGIGFYLAGFSEALQNFVDLPLVLTSTIGLVFLTLMAFVSTNIVLKTQLIFFALAIISLVSFFSGEPSLIEHIQKDDVDLKSSLPFWTVFAVFFPAVTGIEAGLSMSGNLKNPSKSLPIGTIAAVLTGLVVYLAIPIYFFKNVDEYVLMTDPMIFHKISKYQDIVLLSIWGAALSSALGGLLGAPRTLQALAKDDVIPRFFSKESGKDKNPRIALTVTFIIAFGTIYIGNLNIIAPIVSMFFLTSYGMINLSAGIQSILSTPSWRPSFRVHWMIHILGAFGCFAAMFMIDAGSSIISLLLISLVYYIMHRRKLSSYWGDVRRGLLMLLTKYSIEKLLRLPISTQSWYPNILVFTGPPSKRWPLIELGSAIANNRGFLTVSCILPQKEKFENKITTTQKAIEDYLRKKHVSALVRISIDDNTQEGIMSLIQDYGIGPIFPNTVILGFTTEERKIPAFAAMLVKIYQAKRNIVLLRYPTDKKTTSSSERKPTIREHYDELKHKKVCIWWGRRRKNAGLSLSLSYLLQNNSYLHDVELNMRTIVRDEEELETANVVLKKLVEEAHIDASYETYLKKDADLKEVFATIREKSQDCFLNFIGLLPPKLIENEESQQQATNDFINYYREVVELTKELPPTAIVLASEDLEFHRIFSKKT